SVPSISPLDSIDRRYNVDPQIQKQIKYASVVVCYTRPAIGLGMAIDEIKYAISIGKPVAAIQITDSTCISISELKVPVVAKRKDSLEAWISSVTK
ncbi:MAG TPA: hypothetical protein DDW34_12230, partial [Clostridium sp.]|nr:hypothetical protein [Clostridium sp.]